MVDDDANSLKTFGFLLRTAGYDFSAAETGHHGIRLVQSLQPDVAIVDFRLPDLSGIDVLSSIRNSSPLTVSVLLTGFWNLE
jgi:two-component system nitrogen regulation response regulator GlnG